MPRLFPGLPRPLLFAHRGASAFAPENTLDAFELALRQGAHVLELDVHGTRDGEVVVIHDPTLERTTDGRGRVREHGYAELSRLDAGYRFARRPGEHTFRGRGAVIPRMGELLAAFPEACFNIELKQREPSIVAPVLRALERAGASRVVLTAADDAVMRELVAAAPGVALGLCRGEVKELLRAVWLRRPLDAFAGRALQIPPRYRLLPLVTESVIEAAHAVGVEVHVWTIDDPARARALLGRGVDGIMTNDPGALAALFPAAGR